MSEPQKNQALSLLQGILDETAAEAEAAQAQLAQEIERKRAEAQAAKDAEEARRREEIAARLKEEEERQRIAAERREQVLEELRIEELKAKGLWKEPEPVPSAPPVEAAGGERVGASTQTLVAAQQRSRRGVMVAAAAVVLAIGAGGAGAWFYLNQEFVDATTPFSASTPEVVALAGASTVIAFQAIPAPIIQHVEAPPTTATSTTRTTRPRGSSSTRTDTTQPTGPRLNLGGNLGER